MNLPRLRLPSFRQRAPEEPICKCPIRPRDLDSPQMHSKICPVRRAWDAYQQEAQRAAIERPEGFGVA